MSSHADDNELYQLLLDRTGKLHLQQRLGIESESEHRVFHKGRTFFHIENLDSLDTLIRLTLRITGLHGRGQRNALNIQTRHNDIYLKHLPTAFSGYTLLHLSDLHLDMNEQFTDVLINKLKNINYDLCIMTGDYRYLTWGPSDKAMACLKKVRSHIRTPVYAILGNHDSIRTVPAMEKMDIRMLLNESAHIEHHGDSLYLAGIDDPHYFRADNLEKACRNIPSDAVSLLLAHSPEIYKQAAYAGFDVMFSGHTHGGQIKMPGGRAFTYNAKCPRYLCAGRWRHGAMQGYTSVGAGSSIVDVRFNCPPEITLHQLLKC